MSHTDLCDCCGGKGEISVQEINLFRNASEIALELLKYYMY